MNLNQDQRDIKNNNQRRQDRVSEICFELQGYIEDRESAGVSDENKVPSLQELAQEQVCTQVEDAQKSNLTTRIIKSSRKRAGEILEAEETNKSAEEIYSAIFVNDEFITSKEQKYLLAFLSDEKAQHIAQRLFSSVRLLEWDDNTEFLKEYLKDDDWKLTVDKIIPTMIDKVQNYPYVIDTDWENIDISWWFCIHSLTNWVKKVYAKWNNWLVELPKQFESVEVLSNGFVAWQLHNDENTNEEAAPNLEVYEFVDGNFINICNIPGWKRASILDENLLLYSNAEGKKWLKSFYKFSQDTDLRTQPLSLSHLSAKFDEIIKKWKFIIWVSRKDWSQDISIFIETRSGFNEVFDVSFENISQNNLEIEVINDNYIFINWVGLYFYDEASKEINLVPWSLLIWDVCKFAKLLSWNQEIVRMESNNWEKGLYTFCNKTNEIKCLVKSKSGQLHDFGDYNDYEWPYREFYLNLWIFFHEWRVFKLKEWYTYKRVSKLKEWYTYKNEFIKKWFFSKWVKINWCRYDELKDFLEEVPEVDLPITIS